MNFLTRTFRSTTIYKYTCAICNMYTCIYIYRYCMKGYAQTRGIRLVRCMHTWIHTYKVMQDSEIINNRGDINLHMHVHGGEISPVPFSLALCLCLLSLSVSFSISLCLSLSLSLPPSLASSIGTFLPHAALSMRTTRR